MNSPKDDVIDKIRDASALERNELDLSNMGLTTLPTELGDMTNLIGLYLDHNTFTSLPNVVRKLENLVVLSLDSNPITMLPPWLESLYLAELHVEDSMRDYLMNHRPALHEIAKYVDSNYNEAEDVIVSKDYFDE